MTFVRRCSLSDLGQDLCHLLSYFNYNSAGFSTEQSYKTNCTHSNIQDDRSTRFLSLQQNIIKRFYRENSPLDGNVHSCSITYVVYRVMMGFEQKLLKKYILIQFTKSPVVQSPKLTMRAVEYLNER